MTMTSTKQLLTEIAVLERQLQQEVDKREVLRQQIKVHDDEAERLTNLIEGKKKELRETVVNASPTSDKRFTTTTKDPLGNLRKDGVALKFLPGINDVSLCSKLPCMSLIPLSDSKPINTITGPSQPLTPPTTSPSPILDIQSHNDFLSACSYSTYPWLPDTPVRQGDPICDRFASVIFNDCVIMSLSDGCNWGRLPHEASTKASEGFIQFLSDHKKYFTDTIIVGNLLLAALSHAHECITAGHDLWESGTTTLIGGVLLPQENSKWAFVIVSVGDCKAYRWVKTTNNIIDITQGNRNNLADATDPGGRIGQYLADGKPDLRNLCLYYDECSEGDIVFFASDGVHDNLDPQQLGLIPSEFNIRSATWDEAQTKSFTETANAKISFSKKWMAHHFFESPKSMSRVSSAAHLQYPSTSSLSDAPYRRSSVGGPVPDKLVNSGIISLNEEDNNNNGTVYSLTPQKVVTTLLNHCIEVTKASRSFMENTPYIKLPSDYKLYPGKMDHTTIICTRVGSPNSTNTYNSNNNTININFNNNNNNNHIPHLNPLPPSLARVPQRTKIPIKALPATPSPSLSSSPRSAKVSESSSPPSPKANQTVDS